MPSCEFKWCIKQNGILFMKTVVEFKNVPSALNDIVIFLQATRIYSVCFLFVGIPLYMYNFECLRLGIDYLYILNAYCTESICCCFILFYKSFYVH